jgi:tRNA G18 (ribose-2'-O)-methylase SpoU
MVSLCQIESLDDPRLIPYRTMRQQFTHLQQRIFVADGEKVVRRLLTSELKVISVLLPERWLAEFQPLVENRPEQIQLFVTQKAVVEGITGFTMHQGLLAVAQAPEASSIDAVLQKTAPPRLFIAADGVSNSDNVGVLVRNCAAFGGQAIIIGPDCSHPYLRRAVRNSMGAIFNTPVVEAVTLAHSLRELRARNVRSIAAHPHVSGKTIFHANLRNDCCIVFGSEGHGISEAVLNECEEVYAIPMSNGVDSLNVGSASAVFLYEAVRQRNK